MLFFHIFFGFLTEWWSNLFCVCFLFSHQDGRIREWQWSIGAKLEWRYDSSITWKVERTSVLQRRYLDTSTESSQSFFNGSKLNLEAMKPQTHGEIIIINSSFDHSHTPFTFTYITYTFSSCITNVHNKVNK